MITPDDILTLDEELTRLQHSQRSAGFEALCAMHRQLLAHHLTEVTDAAPDRPLIEVVLANTAALRAAADELERAAIHHPRRDE